MPRCLHPYSFLLSNAFVSRNPLSANRSNNARLGAAGRDGTNGYDSRAQTDIDKTVLDDGDEQIKIFFDKDLEPPHLEAIGHADPHTAGHRNYPKVILQADKFGRSAHARISRDQTRVSEFMSKVIPGSKPPLVSSTAEWKRLQRHAEVIKSTHLRDMLQDPIRCDDMYAEHDGVYLDYSRQQTTLETMDLLFELAEKQELENRIKGMFNGEKINFTEDRAVLHTALRAGKDEVGSVFVDGLDAVQEVHDVLDQIKSFTEAIRSGEITGYTGKRMRNIVSVGIGGSYLGPEFLHEVLKTEAEGINSSLGYDLRFLANVDPVDVERTCADLDPEETLIIIVSKTFTTAETMLNARTMRQWLWDFMGNDIDVVRKHVVACSSISAVENVAAFGIDTENYHFRFWDWVGGRYSVCGAAGAVPISLMYGFDLFEKFLEVSIELCKCANQRFSDISSRLTVLS